MPQSEVILTSGIFYCGRILNIRFPKVVSASQRRSRMGFQKPFQFDVAAAASRSACPSLLIFACLDTSMTTNKRAIPVCVKEALVDRLNAVAYALRMRSRSDYIRRSLSNLPWTSPKPTKCRSRLAVTANVFSSQKVVRFCLLPAHPPEQTFRQLILVQAVLGEP